MAIMLKTCSRFSSQKSPASLFTIKLRISHHIKYSYITKSCRIITQTNYNLHASYNTPYHHISYQYSTNKQNQDDEQEEEEDDDEEYESEQETDDEQENANEEIESKDDNQDKDEDVEDDDDDDDQYEDDDDDEQDIDANEPTACEKFLIQYRKTQGTHYTPRDDNEFVYKPLPRMSGPSPFINQDYKKRSVAQYQSIEQLKYPLSSTQPLGGFPEIWIHTSNAVKKSIYKLSPDLFNQDIRIDILWRCLRYERHKNKGWTWHIAKHRGEKHGTGKKLRQQKGTGRARMSDGKAPQFKGGGAAHGRRPKTVETYLPKNVYYMGLKIALTARYQEGDLYVWEDFILPPLQNKLDLNEIDKHLELNDTLIPVNELDNNDNTLLYYDVVRTRQMLNKWGWLKPQLYERVNNNKLFNTIQNAKKTGNIVDILESMPIADFEWDFLKEEDDLIDHTIPTILMIHDGFLYDDFKTSMNRVNGIELMCYDELIGKSRIPNHHNQTNVGKQHMPNYAVFRLLKYKKIIFTANALKCLEDLIGVEAEIDKWNYYAKLNRIRQDEEYRDAFPKVFKGKVEVSMFTVCVLYGIIQNALSAPSKGVTYVDNYDGTQCSDMATLKANWYYNWEPHSICENATKIPYIPMIWSDKDIPAIPGLKGTNYEALLGFNEPDNCNGQACMNVSYALELWPQLMSTGLRLGTPGCTEGGTKSWLKQFMQGIESSNGKLKVDFIAIHWYNNCHNSHDIESLLQYVNNTYPTYPFWLTEYSCMDGDANLNAQFFEESLVYIKQYERLERYSWFTDRWPTNESIYQGVTLFDQNSQLTIVGQDYQKA